MTIEPGYYWIRWQGEMTIIRIDADGAISTFETVASSLSEIGIKRAELGPRIEPPETK